MKTIKITMPLPPQCLSPNWRGHWAKKAEVTKWMRGGAMLLAQAEMDKPPRWIEATVQATFYHRDKRRRDRDNALSSLKAVFDGLADAGVVANDSGLTHLPVRFEVDKEHPRVELVVTPHPRESV